VSQPLLLILVSLTVYRVTRLIVRDGFPPLRLLRRRLAGVEGNRWTDTRWEWFGDLLTCHWCVSPYVSALVVAAVDLLTTTPVALPVLVWVTAAAVAAYLIHLEDVVT